MWLSGEERRQTVTPTPTEYSIEVVGVPISGCAGEKAGPCGWSGLTCDVIEGREGPNVAAN
jgi:hypothetical protein